MDNTLAPPPDYYWFYNFAVFYLKLYLGFLIVSELRA